MLKLRVYFGRYVDMVIDTDDPAAALRAAESLVPPADLTALVYLRRSRGPAGSVGDERRVDRLRRPGPEDDGRVDVSAAWLAAALADPSAARPSIFEPETDPPADARPGEPDP